MMQGTSSAPFTAPTVVILGTDLLLTARPATPVQLAHACLAAGYSAALPVSWGDELLASALALRASARAGAPVIACACPHVADRFEGELDRFLLPVASPPVATARYVRELFAGPVHITYVGACPGAHDPSIDARYTPGEFIARLRELGIDADEQPVVFESVIPPDRRRYESLPGGIPTTDALRRAGASHTLLELDGEDYIIALAQHLFEREAVLIDIAPRLGCACAGAMSAGSLRAAVAALEPPRARTPVVEAAIRVDVEAPPRPVRMPEPMVAQPAIPAPLPAPKMPITAPAAVAASEGDEPMSREAEPEPVPESPLESPLTPVISRADLPDERARRRSPAMGVPRFGLGTPVSRTQQGHVVPRAYLRRRRPWGDLDAPAEPSPHEPTLPAEQVPVERDRQAPIVRHVEPAAEPTVEPRAEPATEPKIEPKAEPKALVHHEPPFPPPPSAPIEVEIPLSRVAGSKLYAADLIPPPPIMPDPHIGESLLVADSLAELIGLETTLAQPIFVPEPVQPSEPEATRMAVPATVVSPPAPRRDAPYPATGTTLETSRLTPSRAAPSQGAQPRPHLPPAVSTPSRRETSRAIPAESATPVEASGTGPRPAARARNAVILPPRRHGTAALLWVLFGTLVILTVFSIRLLMTERLATASPAGATPPGTPASADSVREAVTPTLPPIVVDSSPVVVDSSPAAAESTLIETPPPAESVKTAPAPVRRAPRRVRPPARTGRIPAPTGRAPGPTISVSPAPALKVPIPAPAGSGDTALVTLPPPPRATADSAAPGYYSPRVTRPWPPPSEQ